MTRMIDTNGKEHTIYGGSRNVATLESIGWAVKTDATGNIVLPAVTPTTEREWDAIFGRR